MLVLSFRVGEEAVVDEGRLYVKVVEVTGGRVRLGFYPKAVRVDRSAVHKRRRTGEPPPSKRTQRSNQR
jgi:sRNA-binding carbon storage regulator CsrA